MDLLLTHGYCLEEDPAERAVMRPYPPLGILYLSSHLKQKGFEVQVFDTTFRTLSDFEATINAQRPKVVGIYVNLMTRQNVLRMIGMLRKIGATVIVGGPEPVNYAQEYLDRGADVVVSGEGELTMEALLPHLARHGLNQLETVAGIVYRDPNGLARATAERPKIVNLDDQPFPDRDAIDLRQYMRAWKTHHGQSSVSLITARGCPFKCNWCSHSVFGHSHRRRSPENVAAEVALIRETYAPDLLWYADDVFTIHRKWFFRYAELLTERGLITPFETISREDRLDEEVVAELARLRCFRLWVGAESGSQRILDLMQRQTNAARVREMIKLLQRYGIQAGTFIMLGYEGEELEDLEATVAHLKDALPDQLLTTIAYPIRGTLYYQKAQPRVRALKVFEDGSDRNHTVAGRRSRKFYQHAQEWMVHEVELAKERQKHRPDPLNIARHALRAQKGRLGMLATQHERESA